MKHLEVGQKYSATRRIFNSLLGVLSGDETLRLVPDILLPGYIKAWIPTIVFNTSDMTKLNGKSGKKRKKSLVFTNKISPRRTYLLPVVALRIANQDFCARLVISRIAQDTGRLYSIGTNDIDRKKMLQSYIAKPIAWRILQEVYLPVSMLSMLINHNKTRKLNAFSLP